MEQGGGISGTVSSKWSKWTGGPAGDEYQNLVATETVGTLCSDTHPGAYSGQDAYTGRLVPMKAKGEPVACYDYLGTQGGGVEVGISPTLKRKDGVAVTVPSVAFNIYPGQPSEGRPAELHAKQTDVANAVTVTEHARTTDRGTRVVCATGERTHTLDRAHGATEDGTGRRTPIVPVVQVIQPTMAVRRLVPVETEKLQGFPREWTSEGIDKEGRRIVMSDSSRYKQMGNAVTVNVAHALAERVRAVLESE